MGGGGWGFQTLAEVSELSGCCCCQTDRWAVAVRCCQVVLSGCCQALTHTSHTYDTIKRALTIKGALTPMTPAATQLPPPPTA